MNKGKIRAGLLALAIAMAPVACGPAAATAAVTGGGGSGHCHGDKTDPNPEHGNDQCRDDTQVSEVERVILWAAPSTDGVVPGRSPAGLAPSGSSWTGPAICLGALLVVAGAVLYGAARSGRAAE